MIDTGHSLALIAVMAAVTALLRFAPFILFSRNTPRPVLYLGRVLPYSIIAMLTVYCLKDVDIFAGSHGIPEFISVIFVALLHKWRHNTLLSVLCGTLFYMFLLQVVFA